MRRTRFISLAAAMLLAASAPPPDHTAETREIARAFIHRQFELGDVSGAKAQYFAPDYIQHNPEIPSGLQGDTQFFEARRQREPDKYRPVGEWHNVNDRLLVQGKYFALHHHLFTSPNDTGRVFFDLWRVENGKVVEHWDIIQPVDKAPLNANTMWSDKAPKIDGRRGGSAPEAVIRAYLHIGLDEHDPRRAAQLYIDEAFVQHSPHIADGKAALLAYFAARDGASGDKPLRTSTTTHIIADGELVAVTRHVVRTPRDKPGDKGVMYADLFRVRRGKIVEHWDVIQAVPETSVNGNTMW